MQNQVAITSLKTKHHSNEKKTDTIHLLLYMYYQVSDIKALDFNSNIIKSFSNRKKVVSINSKAAYRKASFWSTGRKNRNVYFLLEKPSNTGQHNFCLTTSK